MPPAHDAASTAAEVMAPGPRSVAPHSTITEAALVLADEGSVALPVTDAGRPVGLLAARALVAAVANVPDLPGRPVAELMAADPPTVPRDAPLEEVRARLADARSGALLVVNPDGSLAGIITPADLEAHTPADATDRPRRGGGRATAASPGSGETWYKPAAFWSMLKATYAEWTEDKAPRLGAALSFYSVLSLAPLLILAIAVAGSVFGEEAARGELVGKLRDLVGEEGGQAIEEMIKNASKPGSGIVASIVGVATLLFGASGVFGGLQDAMNTIWEVRPRPDRGLLGMVKDRFLSFGMVLVVGFLLLVSLVLSTALAAATGYLAGLAPGLGPLARVANELVSFGVVALLFAMIFKYLPDARIAWRDVWVGAGLTAALFALGKFAIGLYLGRASVGSAYGAAGSLVVLLVWVYYSSQILFFGAEFTQVYADRYGSQIRPDRGAEEVAGKDREQQGIPRGATSGAG